jgi:hypothetical protein
MYAIEMLIVIVLMQKHRMAMVGRLAQQSYFYSITHIQWRCQASEFGGAFEAQTHILGGQDRIFKKVLLFAHAVVTGLLSTPQEIRRPLKRGRYS